MEKKFYNNLNFDKVIALYILMQQLIFQKLLSMAHRGRFHGFLMCAKFLK